MTISRTATIRTPDVGQTLAVVGDQATILGTAKDGGPSCATVKPIDGWRVAK